MQSNQLYIGLYITLKDPALRFDLFMIQFKFKNEEKEIVSNSALPRNK